MIEPRHGLASRSKRARYLVVSRQRRIQHFDEHGAFEHGIPRPIAQRQVAALKQVSISQAFGERLQFKDKLLLVRCSSSFINDIFEAR